MVVSPNRLLASLMICGALFTTPAIGAMPDDSTRQIAVHADDLNLATRAGAAALNRRVMHAVESVCGADTSDAHNMALIAKCRRTAMQNANQQVQMALATVQNAPVLASNDIKKPAHGL